MKDLSRNNLEMLDHSMLIKMATTKMPFGKYAGTVLFRLPEEYLLWFEKKGWPKGELGVLMQAMLEIKVNGLEYLLEPIYKASQA